jgi:hypothetical protein
MPKRRLTFLTAIAAAGILLVGFGASAQAASVNDHLVFDGSTVNGLHDLDGEYLVKDKNNSATNTIEVNDIIRGGITINNNDQVSGSFGDEFTGIFSLKVAAILNSSNGVGDIVFTVDGTFGDYLNTLGLLDSGDVSTFNSSGTLIRLYEMNTSGFDYTSDLSGVDNNIATAGGGNYYMDIGFSDATKASHVESGSIVSDNGEGWVAPSGGLDLTQVSGSSSSAPFGTGYFSLSRTGSGVNGGYPIVPWPFLSDTIGGSTYGTILGVTGGITDTEFVGTSTVYAPSDNMTTAGFALKSSTNFNFVAAPLPAAAIPGLMLLLGLGVSYGWRRKKAIA